MARKASRTTFLTTNDSLDEPKLQYPDRGFTIVELLIVIVVIAILAAITAVAYTGIRERAALSALQSEISQQARQLAAWKAQNNDQYPATLGAARTAGMLNNSSGTEYTKYIVSNSTSPANYCATGLRAGISYSVIGTSSAPILGECVTNLLTNPGLESATLDWGGSAVSVSRDTTTGQSGSASIRFQHSGAAIDGYAQQWSNVPVTAGQTYSLSGWIRKSGPASNVSLWLIFSNGSGTVVQTSASNTNELTPSSSWSRRTVTAIAPTGATVVSAWLGIGRPATSDVFYADSLLLTEGGSSYSYGDGSSNGWFWNGATNSSTSTGPAIAI